MSNEQVGRTSLPGGAEDITHIGILMGVIGILMGVGFGKCIS